MIVPNVVQQHADDAAALAANRIALVEAPTPTLHRLLRFDRRLQSHFDGLRIAGQPGWALCEGTLETPSRGSVCAVAVRALDERDDERLRRVIGVAQAVEETRAGLWAAFEWVE